MSGGAYPTALADEPRPGLSSGEMSHSCPQEERKTEETELEILTLRKQLDVL
jgi:hypothetical protein